MATFQISAELREDKGKGASRRLRRSGKVPGIVYGGGKNATMLTLDENELKLALAKESFYTNILELAVGDKRQKVILRDVQRHPARPAVEHIDFQRIIASEKVRMQIPLHFINEETSPAGKMSGVVISHQVTSVEVMCLPEHLPEFIEVDLGEIDVGDIIHLSDLVLPEGVTLLASAVEQAEPVATAAHVQEIVEEEEIVEGEEGEEGELPEGEEAEAAEGEEGAAEGEKRTDEDDEKQG